MKRFAQLVLLSVVVSAPGCSGLRPKPVYTTSDRDTAPTVAADEAGDRSLDEPLVSTGGSMADGDRQRVMGEVDDMLGVPYRFGGNDKWGIDCSAFVQTVYKNALSLELPRQAGDMFEIGRPVANGELAFGDLVFFKDIEDKGTSHVGIYLDAGRFAHASVSSGVIISGMRESYYRKRYVGAKRVASP